MRRGSGGWERLSFQEHASESPAFITPAWQSSASSSAPIAFSQKFRTKGQNEEFASPQRRSGVTCTALARPLPVFTRSVVDTLSSGYLATVRRLLKMQ
jgi:hypothetical protein